MNKMIKVKPKIKPPIDPGFAPAVLWNRAFRELARKSGEARKIVISLERTKGSVSVFETEVLPDKPGYSELNLFYVERMIKYLLWMKGGWKNVGNPTSDPGMAVGGEGGANVPTGGEDA